MIRQSSDHIWMTEPVLFHCNQQTMATNTYQSDDPPNIDEVQKLALGEFHRFRDRLVAAGVHVTTVLGHDDSPDDIFPNWASTHDDGQGGRFIVYYPMLNENRRIERRPEMMTVLERQYRVALDMTAYEAQNRALESTSALWMDRVHKVAYSSHSARADRLLAQEWCDFMGYRFVPFETRNHVGKPVYHTDVMMFIGTGFIGVCLDCIVPEDRARVRESLEATGREIIEITNEQLLSFCGNCLEVEARDGTKKLVMSASAFEAYRPDQKERFLKHVSEIVYSDLATIQKYGGGAARCMLMELF